MPTDQDRHTLHHTGNRRPLPRRASVTLDEEEAELRALLAHHMAERTALYVPLPRLIQE